MKPVDYPDKLAPVAERVAKLHASLNEERWPAIHNHVEIMKCEASLDGLGSSSTLVSAEFNFYEEELEARYRFLLKHFEETFRVLRRKPKTSDADAIVSLILWMLGPVAGMLNDDLENTAKNANILLVLDLQHTLDRIERGANTEVELLICRVRAKITEQWLKTLPGMLFSHSLLTVIGLVVGGVGTLGVQSCVLEAKQKEETSVTRTRVSEEEFLVLLNRAVERHPDYNEDTMTGLRFLKVIPEMSYGVALQRNPNDEVENTIIEEVIAEVSEKYKARKPSDEDGS